MSHIQGILSPGAVMINERTKGTKYLMRIVLLLMENIQWLKIEFYVSIEMHEL